MSITNSDQSKYKWEVKPGGTQTADSLNIGHTVSQTGTTSIKKSLLIGQNHTDVSILHVHNTVAVLACMHL